MSPRRVVLGLAVALFLALSLAAPTSARPSIPSSTVLAPHDPITIVGDANFTAANGVTGGDGTPGNPFIISGWNITDRWPFDGIAIGNTRAHVVMRDIVIDASSRDVEPEFPRAVALYNVSDVIVERVTVLNNAYAFEVGGGSSNVTIRNSVAVGNWVGVAITNSVDVRVEGNLLQGGDVPNPSASMSVGVTMGSCGAPVCPAVRVTIVGNRITNNIAGIRVVTSSAITVYHNNFINNTNPAFADAANYSWDDGYPSGGNYWSGYGGVDLCSGPQQDVCTGPDGIGDTPLSFPAGAQDRYPLMRPWLGSSHASHAPIYISGDANFTAANGVVSGSGSGSDPYVIEGWSISQPNYASAITIVNTTAYFTVRDVVLNVTGADPEVGPRPGVSLTNASNGVVLNVTTVPQSNSLGPPPVLIASSCANLRILNNTMLVAYVYESANVIVEGNQINRFGVFSSNNTHLTYNAFVNGYGLDLENDFNVTVIENVFRNNDPVGVQQRGSTWVQVFWNNFIGNYVHSASFSDGTGNRWDSGYPSGGNYWSNYTGVDVCNGPDQTNCTGPDGIGDAPFIVGWSNWAGSSHGLDQYPLMQPYPIPGESPPPPPALRVSIAASPVHGTMPLTVTFNSTVSGGVPPYQYAWHLGDGSTSTAANTVHIYLTGGDFPVWLDVWDHARGDAQSSVLFVNVTAAAVNLTVTMPTEFVSSSAGITVSFTSSANGGTPPYTYLWDFGDGSRSTDASPVHTYARAGTYTVTVTATDAHGQNATRTFSLSVFGRSAPPDSPFPLALGAAVVASGALAIMFAALWLRERRRRVPPPNPPT